jgi:hypothetical protein
MQYVVSRSSLFNSKDCANGYFVACIIEALDMVGSGRGQLIWSEGETAR